MLSILPAHPSNHTRICQAAQCNFEKIGDRRSHCPGFRGVVPDCDVPATGRGTSRSITDENFFSKTTPHPPQKRPRRCGLSAGNLPNVIAPFWGERLDGHRHGPFVFVERRDALQLDGLLLVRSLRFGGVQLGARLAVDIFHEFLEEVSLHSSVTGRFHGAIEDVREIATAGICITEPVASVDHLVHHLERLATRFVEGMPCPRIGRTHCRWWGRGGPFSLVLPCCPTQKFIEPFAIFPNYPLPSSTHHQHSRASQPGPRPTSQSVGRIGDKLHVKESSGLLQEDRGLLQGQRRLPCASCGKSPSACVWSQARPGRFAPRPSRASSQEGLARSQTPLHTSRSRSEHSESRGRVDQALPCFLPPFSNFLELSFLQGQ